VGGGGRVPIQRARSGEIVFKRAVCGEGGDTNTGFRGEMCVVGQKHNKKRGGVPLRKWAHQGKRNITHSWGEGGIWWWSFGNKSVLPSKK